MNVGASTSAANGGSAPTTQITRAHVVDNDDSDDDDSVTPSKSCGFEQGPYMFAAYGRTHVLKFNYFRDKLDIEMPYLEKLFFERVGEFSNLKKLVRTRKSIKRSLTWIQDYAQKLIDAVEDVEKNL